MARRFRLTLTTQIFIGLGLGILVGFIIHSLDSHPETKAEIIAWVRVLSRIFLSLIKVIIAPLIFSTLVVGIAGAGASKRSVASGSKRSSISRSSRLSRSSSASAQSISPSRDSA